MYLPRDCFLLIKLVVLLVNAQYRQNYRIWKCRLDANTRATDFLVDHLRDPLLQVIEAPVRIPFVPVRAAELRWWNGYFNTYHSFDNLILLGDHYQNSFNQRAIRLYPGTRVKVPKISTPQHWPSSKWVYRLYNYLPTLTFTFSVQKKWIGYIKTSIIKSTALIYGGYPLLTQHYRVETLDQLWNEVSPTRSL
jgi:hypothetical protein